MALVTSHTLNGTDGTHAGGIAVRLVASNAPDLTLFDTNMDEGGRLSQEVDQTKINPDLSYDLIFQTGSYWATRTDPIKSSQSNEQIVIRFRMPNPKGHYHMPVILNPNSYSIWISGE
jgi:5-hydroxyisourate hydrolase